MTTHRKSRRLFLRTAAALGPLGPAGVPFALNLATLGAAAAQSATDYRALVCIFLYGGNDAHNTVLATDATSWTEYQRLRSIGSAIALPAVGSPNGVLPIVPATAQAGRSFALHPGLAPLKTLFDAGRTAVVANVGPLVAPLTKAQYNGSGAMRPPKLFSHNDQSSTWQAYGPEGSRIGWAGRMGDLLGSLNTQQTFTCVSVSGTAVWLSGENVTQYQVGTNGATAISGISGSLFGSASAAAALRDIVTSDSTNLFAKAHGQVTRRAIDAQASLSAAMLPVSALEAVPTLPGTTTTNGLANQLLTVARMIGGRAALGVRRQAFFVSIGGLDTHDNQLTQHGQAMTTLGQAIAYFDRLLSSPAINAANEVTTFTASEFGRTLTSNGDGTDHGWGAHHFVTGAAVVGGDVYGRFPATGVGTNDDVGQGRLLPVASVDQYAATLGRWFGATDTQLLELFPNLSRFGTRDLGFMRA